MSTKIYTEYDIVQPSPRLVRAPPTTHPRTHKRSETNARIEHVRDHPVILVDNTPKSFDIENDPAARSKAEKKREAARKRAYKKGPSKEEQDIDRWVTRTTPSGTTLMFPDFDTIKPYTHTIIASTNLTLNISELFFKLPITNYIIVPKRRGRKKKDNPVDPNEWIPDGSIITLKMKLMLRGVNLTAKKPNPDKDSKTLYFRNAVTVVMYAGGKRINFKVSKNGKFQLTGVRTIDQAHACVKTLWKYIMEYPSIYTFSDSKEIPTTSPSRVVSPVSDDAVVMTDRKAALTASLKERMKVWCSPDDTTVIRSPGKQAHPGTLQVIFVPAMANVFFSLGFFVDRVALDRYFNTHTNYYSLLETDIGYTGCNCKAVSKKPMSDLRLTRLDYSNGVWVEPKTVPYSDYLSTLTPKEILKKNARVKYNTFLAFHSGKVIMSGMCAEYMVDTYNDFLDIIAESHDVIREQLRT